MSSDLFSSMLVAIRDHMSAKQAMSTLEGISLTSEFSMTLAVLPSDDEACLKAIFDNLMSKLYSMTTNLGNNPFGNDKDKIPIF